MPAEEKFVHFLHALQQHRGRLTGHHSRVRKSDNHSAHEIFQSSTINALLQGLYDGDMTYGQLRAHGNFGLGTFNALDGEMIALDGNFYQIKSDGLAYPVDDSQKTPFAVVQFFKPDFRDQLNQEMGYEQFKSYLHRVLPAENLFYAIRVDGFFTRIEVRSVSRQIPPYLPLVEAIKTESVYKLSDVQGTLIGFRFPDYAAGVNVPGYHLHFIASEYDMGGHVLGFQLKEGQVAVEHTSEFYMELPGKGALPDAGPTDVLRDKIRKVEE